MEDQKIIGVNCYNCLYASKETAQVTPEELNDKGGIDPKTDENRERAKEADLITLPGNLKSEVTSKRFCNNEKVEMFVTSRMVCAYWDNEGVERPWLKKIPEPQYIDQIM